jgi:hypothetical protein
MIFGAGEIFGWEMAPGSAEGSVIFSKGSYSVEIEDVIGDQYGVHRYIGSVNRAPALIALSRGVYYYTLDAGSFVPSVDCIYYDDRNKRNGARVSAGMCGLSAKIDSGYVDIVEEFGSRWTQGVYSFDTYGVFSSGKGKDFFLAKIGDVSVFDAYKTPGAIDAVAPEKILKSSAGCYSFERQVVFLVYVVGSDGPVYLDVLLQSDPVQLKRLGIAELAALAVGGCE